MKKCLSAGLVLVLSFSAACAQGDLPGETESIFVDGVAAYVNEHVVTVGEIMASVEPVLRQLSRSYAGAQLQRKLRQAFEEGREAAIDRYLILDAYENGEMQIPDWVVDQRVDEVVREMFADDRAALMEALTRDRMTYDEWREQIRKGIVVSSMRGLHVNQHLRVPPGKVKAYYDDNARQYQRPERVKLLMIVIEKGKTEAERAGKLKVAEDALARVKGGEEFSVVARQVSEGNKAEQGGDWGWTEPMMLRSELAGAVGVLSSGGVSDLIDTEDSFYIVKVDGHQKKSSAPFDEVREAIENLLRQNEGEKLLKQWTKRLRLAAYVKVLDVDVF